MMHFTIFLNLGNWRFAGGNRQTFDCENIHKYCLICIMLCFAGLPNNKAKQSKCSFSFILIIQHTNKYSHTDHTDTHTHAYCVTKRKSLSVSILPFRTHYIDFGTVPQFQRDALSKLSNIQFHMLLRKSHAVVYTTALIHVSWSSDDNICNKLEFRFSVILVEYLDISYSFFSFT